MKEKILFKTVFGSHLYGTDNDKSDRDFKGVYLPEQKDVILGRVKKTITFNSNKNDNIKNTKDDVDIEYYSLHYFIKLACQGQTVALDMLHAPMDKIIVTSEIWEQIYSERKRFYTKNLDAFVGYARKQASKYGLKGSRLAVAKDFLDLISGFDSNTRLESIWNLLPSSGEHTKKLGKNNNGVYEFKICGKILQSRMKIEHAYNCIKKYYDEYSDRAKLAEKNDGIDWKAVSHACRAALQVREILLNNTITFPLRQAKLLKEIKSGILSYSNFVSPYLENLMSEIDELSSKSQLPDTVDVTFWDDFIYNVYK